MDGSKSDTDTLDYESNSVERRSVRVEASVWAGVDRPEMRILPEVAAKMGWNPIRQKSKIFPAIIMSRELVDPNLILNCYKGKGIRLIFRNRDHTCGNASLVLDASG